MRFWAWLLVFSLAACVSTDPADVELHSVEAVSWRDQMEMPGRDMNPVYSLVPCEVLEQDGQSALGSDRPHQLLLKVKYQTSENLFENYIAAGYNLGVYAKPCDAPERFPQLANTFVYWRGSMLDDLRSNIITPETPDDKFVYYFFIHGLRTERFRDNTVWPTYDIRQAKDDICFYLAGLKVPFGKRSNTAVINRAAIDAALREMPPDLK